MQRRVDINSVSNQSQNHRMNPDDASSGRSPWLELQSVDAWLEGHRIVHNLSLKLWPGQSTAILGRNGAGKSTLVKLINRSLYPVVQPPAPSPIRQ